MSAYYSFNYFLHFTLQNVPCKFNFEEDNAFLRQLPVGVVIFLKYLISFLVYAYYACAYNLEGRRDITYQFRSYRLPKETKIQSCMQTYITLWYFMHAYQYDKHSQVRENLQLLLIEILYHKLTTHHFLLLFKPSNTHYDFRLSLLPSLSLSLSLSFYLSFFLPISLIHIENNGQKTVQLISRS